MDNNSTETVEATLTSQKENKPPLATDGRKRSSEVEIIASELEPISTSTIHSFRVGVFENPLKVRNMAARAPNQKISDQMQLLEKFKKLRQWQQQQQETMCRQQQQQMEALRMEQNKLQSILAMQKRFQGKRNILSPTQQPPPPVITLNPQDIRQENPSGGERQHVQNVEVLRGENPELSNNNTNGGAIPSSSCTLSWSAIPNAVPVQLADGTSVHHAGHTVTQQQQDYSCHEFEATLSSFNKTLYPTMWNSSNYALPLGPMPPSATGEVASLGLCSIPQLVGGRNVNTTSSLMGRNTGAVPEAAFDVKASGGTEELERLWTHSPIGETDSYVESLCDNQSEGDTMSGVYPLYDSESEIGGSEEHGRNQNEWEAISKGEDELVEDGCHDEKNSTVIENLPEREPQVSTEGENGTSGIDDGGSGHEERRPIKPGIGGSSSARTFEQLLEEQLKIDEMKASSTAPSSKVENQPPRRPFLRKGQGLARYQGKKLSSKVEAPKRGSTSQVAQPLLRKPTKDVPPQAKQDTQRNAPAAPGKVTRKIASKSVENVAERGHEPSHAKQQLHGSNVSKSRATGPSKTASEITVTKTTLVPSRSEVSNAANVLTSSIDASFQMRLREWEQHQEIEEEELEEFELLEQAAANASFSSNSSVVVKVLAKARGHPPPYKKKIIKEPTVKSIEDRGNVLSPVDTGYGSEEGKVVLTTEDLEETTRMRHEGYQESEKGSEDEDSDVTLQEISLDSALDLEDGEEDPRIKGYNQQQTKYLEDKAISYPVSTSSLALQEDFNDEETWGEIKSVAGRKSDKDNDDDDDDDSDVTISDIFPLVSTTPPMHLKGVHLNSGEKASDRPAELVTSTPPTSALVTKLFPQLKPKQNSMAPPQQPTAVQSVNAHAPACEEKERSSVQTVQSQAVREKLKELETEIEKFRAENAALAKIRVEREEGLTKLHSEIAAFEKQKAEELERLETFREEELKKIRRERRVFEKYQKAARAIPDKKERDEIEGLRGQVAELQEELKRRESRWSAASTRYRQKLESSEQKNKELQEELKLLEQYRLQQWREEKHTKAIEAEDTRAKKSFQRKTAKAAEEETGPRHTPFRDSPPNKPSLFEAEFKSTPETFISDDRSPPLDKDPNLNKTTGFGVTEVLSKAEDESREVLDSTRTSGSSCENQSSKRSPRRRKSKTPDSGEKKRKNVRFQDENKVDLNETGEGSSMAEMKEMTRELEILHADGKAEKVNIDGSRVISFANGTRKEISADGQTITVNFFNGDIKQILPDQRVVYYYSDAQTTHTTYPDGLEVLQFPSKQIEKHYRDGAKEIIFPDQTVKYLYPNGAEECVFSDGTIQRVSLEGDRIIEFPNGQRETHTKHYKKREYPDGTVKTVYPDGRTETRYATGRVRVRDRDGRVLVDTAEQDR